MIQGITHCSKSTDCRKINTQRIKKRRRSFRHSSMGNISFFSFCDPGIKNLVKNVRGIASGMQLWPAQSSKVTVGERREKNISKTSKLDFFLVE